VGERGRRLTQALEAALTNWEHLPPVSATSRSTGQPGDLRFDDLRHSYATWHECSSTTLDRYTRRIDDPPRVSRALDDDFGG
jgi:hypothetical protein